MGQSADGRRRITADPLAVDDSECRILHVDMDAFFAAVELRRRPELLGRPMMVAGESGRGVVLSASYEARRYGIRSAMPTAAARARCPGIVVVPPDQAAYHRVSEQVMQMFRDVTPMVEPLSVDEAFLDVAGARRALGRPVQIAIRLRERIAGELRLTATIGVASSKFVAKLASGLAKPNGLLVVPPAEVAALLEPLPVRALWGVGPKTATVLQNLGLTTVGEIARTGRAQLTHALGSALGTKLHRLANGADDRTVETELTEASLGAESTFEVDVGDRQRLDRELLDLADRTARRARVTGLRGRTVVLKVRFSDFSTITRSMTITNPTDVADVIYHTVRDLLDRHPMGGRRVRLVGVRLEGLVASGSVVEQLELAAQDKRPGWDVAERASDQVNARFGAAGLRRATLLNPHRGSNGLADRAE